jgi:hypothetical protein
MLGQGGPEDMMSTAVMPIPGAAAMTLVTKNAVAPAVRLAGAPLKEAYEWLVKKYPKLYSHADIAGRYNMAPEITANMVEKGLVQKVRGEAHLPWEKINHPIADIGINENHFISGAFQSPREMASKAVDSISHEGQHLVNYIQQPGQFTKVYDLFNAARGYAKNPMEAIANLTGGTQQARFLAEQGAHADDVAKAWAGTISHGGEQLLDKEKDVLLRTVERIAGRGQPEQAANLLRRAYRGMLNTGHQNVRDILGKNPSALQSVSDVFEKQDYSGPIYKAIMGVY